MNKNMNELVVSIYAVAADERNRSNADLGFAEPKVKNNIIEGRSVDPVEGIPAEYVPDWAAWKEYYNSVGADAFAKEWVSMNERRRALSMELASMWEDGDYAGMVKAMTEYTPAPLEG